MTPVRWRQVKEICGAVLDYAPEQRKAVLAQSCAGDEELRREVEGPFEGGKPMVRATLRFRTRGCFSGVCRYLYQMFSIGSVYSSKSRLSSPRVACFTMLRNTRVF